MGVCGALAGLVAGGWIAATTAGGGSTPDTPDTPALRTARLSPEPALRPRTDGGLHLADLPTFLAHGFARWSAASPPGELECLADAVYYEARGEPASGQAAVAQVVLNRTRTPGFPRRICGVVFQRTAAGCQFSFACDGSLRPPREPAAWDRSRAVARQALEGAATPQVAGALYFRVADVRARWGGFTRVARIGAHVFYGLTRPARSPT